MCVSSSFFSTCSLQFVDTVLNFSSISGLPILLLLYLYCSCLLENFTDAHKEKFLLVIQETKVSSNPNKASLTPASFTFEWMYAHSLPRLKKNEWMNECMPSHPFFLEEPSEFGTMLNCLASTSYIRHSCSAQGQESEDIHL